MASKNILMEVIYVGLIGLLCLSCASGRRYYDGYGYNYDHYASILRKYYDNHGYGQFNYGYETSNGIRQQASGYIKNPYARPQDQIQVIQGSYSYYGADGKLYTVNYIADENGFQPQGAHLTNVPSPSRNPVYYEPPFRPQRPRSTGRRSTSTSSFYGQRRNKNTENEDAFRYWQFEQEPMEYA